MLLREDKVGYAKGVNKKRHQFGMQINSAGNSGGCGKIIGLVAIATQQMYKRVLIKENNIL